VPLATFGVAYIARPVGGIVLEKEKIRAMPRTFGILAIGWRLLEEGN
jgi:hypothetical protein